MWKDIPNFNGRYQISHYGRVYDTKTLRFLKPHMSGVKRRNYPQVTLYKKDGSKHTKRMHTLMGMTFFGYKSGNRKVVMHHLDNDPLNYHITNLKKTTMKENHYRNQKLAE